MKFVILVIVCIVLLISGCTTGLRTYERSLDKRACEVFAIEAERETKFIDYNYWHWDCLTPTQDGKWISATLLREFGSEK